MTADEPFRIESCQKRVRVMLAGQWVAHTASALLVWEKPYYPTYFFPTEDVVDGVLVPAGESRRSSRLGPAEVYDVEVEGVRAAAAARRHAVSPIVALRDAVAFEWGAMDHWFEEREEVFVHARNPYTRIDVLASDRHVRIEVNGTVLAETTSPTMLFETGLPARTYFPMTDLRMDLLEPSDSVTRCPYKGAASYWSFADHADVAWSYSHPVRESIGIAGLVAFYDERVDVFVDGVLQERPKSVFA